MEKHTKRERSRSKERYEACQKHKKAYQQKEGEQQQEEDYSFEEAELSNELLYSQIEQLRDEAPLIIYDQYPTQQKNQKEEEEEEEIVSEDLSSRQLLISQIWFLHKYQNLSKNVIYVGAAPGTHILTLVKFFPKHQFTLIDSLNYCQSLQNNSEPRIHLINQVFTEELATKLSIEQASCLFISEIDLIEEYQQQQQINWCRILKPKKSLLKLKLPEQKSLFFYLEGFIHVQPWSPSDCTEIRLIPSSDDYNKIVQHENTKYKSQINYHNNFIRKKQCINNDNKQNWDWIAEMVVLGDFLVKNRYFWDRKYDFLANISKLSKNITEWLRNDKQL